MTKNGEMTRMRAMARPGKRASNSEARMVPKTTVRISTSPTSATEIHSD